jgi:uncharacterized protein
VTAGANRARRRTGVPFRDRYGPWALVAGASEGIGAAFAAELAGRGLPVVLVARRAQQLAEVAAGLPTERRTVTADLSTMDGLDTVFAATAGLDVGLVVVNAAYAPIGAFLDRSPAHLTRVLDLNCRTPLLLARHYLPAMVARGRGGLVIMSSLSGQQGSPAIVTYAASKAFGRVLAEGLWAELRPAGVDVLACVAGAVATPAYERAIALDAATAGGPAAGAARRAPGTVSPAEVAAVALRGLGRGPTVVPGGLMRVAAPLMSRVVPRRAAIAAMGRATARLSGTPVDGT